MHPPPLTSPAVTSSFVPRGRPRCSSVELDGDVILVDNDSGAVHLLNPTAKIIWSCFDGSGSIADIARDLSEVFAVDLDAVTQAVVDLARRLGEHGLLQDVPRTAGDSRFLPPEGSDPVSEGRRPTVGREEPRFLAPPPST